MLSRLCVFAALLAGSSALVEADVWPDFRGPHHNGYVVEVGAEFPLKWAEDENVIWKVPVHDRGLSTPVIWGDRIWMTTATEDGKKLYVLAFNKESGEKVHDQLIKEVAEPQPLGNAVNSYATPSPVIEEGRVYIHFGSELTACIDSKTGETLWERKDLECNHYRGPSSSPILHENLLILTFDGSDFQYLVGLDKETGKTVWRRDRSTDFNDLDQEGKPTADGDYRKAHSTPLVVTVADGSKQLLSPGAKAAWAYDPATGDELWHIPHEGFSCAARPVYHEGLALIGAGYPRGETYAVRLEGGEKGKLPETQIVWRTTTRTPHRVSPVIVDELVYFVTDGGVLSGVSLEDGKSVWSERLEGQYSASLIYANGIIYAFSEQGTATLFRPGREYNRVAELTLDEGMMASPATDGESLYLRTMNHLYRIGSQ